MGEKSDIDFGVFLHTALYVVFHIAVCSGVSRIGDVRVAAVGVLKWSLWSHTSTVIRSFQA